VRSLVLVGQVDVHVDPGDRLLFPLIFVENGDRVANAFHPDLVDIYLPVIFMVLYVFHGFCCAPAAFEQLIIDASAHKVNEQKKGGNSEDGGQETEEKSKYKAIRKTRKKRGMISKFHDFVMSYWIFILYSLFCIPYLFFRLDFAASFGYLV